MKRGFFTACATLSLVSASIGAEYFTERFSFSGEFDLNQLSMTFTPDGDTNFTVNAVEIDDFPIRHTSHVPVSMGNHTSGDFDFPTGKTFPFYGVEYIGLYMGSSGYFTFTGQNWDTWLTESEHFFVPRVATLAGDWHPYDGGTVKVGLLPDRFVLTFIDVPLWGQAMTASYQTELHYDGTIVMSWVDVPGMPSGTLIGLSAGGGIPVDYVESDLSEFARDRDEDGILDAWERLYFATHDDCITTNDVDGDGYDNFAEFVAGTIPTDGASYFMVSNAPSMSGPIVVWPSVEGRTYSILHCPNLADGFAPLHAGLEYPINAYTSTAPGVVGFYKVEVELSE